MPLFAALALAVTSDRVSLVVCTPVSSDLNRVGDYVLYRVAESARVGGVSIPEGAPAVGKVKRQSKRQAFSLGRVLLKGDTPFASPHAVISISAEYVMLPDGRTVSLEIDPAPREDDLNERMKLVGEFWPQTTLEPEYPSAPLSDDDREQWERLFRVATDRRVSVGRLASSKDGNEFLHNSLASMRDVLAVRQTVEFVDKYGAEGLTRAAKALRGHSASSLSRDKQTTQAFALTFAAAIELSNLYSRTHRGIRGWERRKQISILPGVLVQARVRGVD